MVPPRECGEYGAWFSLYFMCNYQWLWMIKVRGVTDIRGKHMLHDGVKHNLGQWPSMLCYEVFVLFWFFEPLHTFPSLTHTRIPRIPLPLPDEHWGPGTIMSPVQDGTVSRGWVKTRIPILGSYVWRKFRSHSFSFLYLSPLTYTDRDWKSRNGNSYQSDRREV